MIKFCIGDELKNCTYQHPVFREQQSLPFFDAAHVQEFKGTGLVHTAPAHGLDDFIICMKNGISIVSISRKYIINNFSFEFFTHLL